MGKKIDVNDLLLNRNIYTNIIGYNPQESDYRKMTNMDLKEFAKLHGFRFRKKKFKKLLDAAKVDGKPVFTFMDNGKEDASKTIILVNPYVIKPLNESSEGLLKPIFN